MDFIPIDPQAPPPSPSILCPKLASMHRNSVSSDWNSFGYSSLACHDSLRQHADWHESWAAVFGRLLIRLYDLETSLHGPWNEQCQAEFRKLVDRTIPRLLGALQSDGRSIKPCLVHGNLSATTMVTNMDTDEPVLLSPRPLYAHNEYDLGGWCRKNGPMPWPFLREYQKQFPPSQPVEEWDDRLQLYSIVFNLQDAPRRSSLALRQQLYEDAKFLNGKYCPLTISNCTAKCKTVGEAASGTYI